MSSWFVWSGLNASLITLMELWAVIVKNAIKTLTHSNTYISEDLWCFACFRMYKITVPLSVLVAVVCGKSVLSLKPMSQEMIDFINNEAQTTWKVCIGYMNCLWLVYIHLFMDRTLFRNVFSDFMILYHCNPVMTLRLRHKFVTYRTNQLGTAMNKTTNNCQWNTVFNLL